MEHQIAAIKETLNQYAEHVCAGDFEAWLSLWIEDGIQMPPDTPARVGKAEIRAGMKPSFDGMNLDMVIHEIQDARVFGDHGLTRCRYTLKLTPKVGGETLVAMADGKALTLYERQTDGAWEISYDCFNSSQSAA